MDMPHYHPDAALVMLVLCGLQMTKANVGSLLVFDASKLHLNSSDVTPSGDAVEGIVTERGTACCNSCETHMTRQEIRLISLATHVSHDGHALKPGALQII